MPGDVPTGHRDHRGIGRRCRRDCRRRSATLGRSPRRSGGTIDERNHLISRYPLIDPPGADGAYAFVEVAPGRVVAVANLHLTSDPYGPYAVRDGASADDVLGPRNERLACPTSSRCSRRCPSSHDQGIPLFVTGDFNSPSYLDWTQAVADVRPDVPYAVSWPVTETLGAAGLHDSYRDVNPDPVAKPGFTWTPGGPESAPEGQEVMDRIDLVLATGEATTTASKIIGEVDGPDVDIAMSPYPSDHRAVVSTFSVQPQSARPFAAVAQRRVFIGDRLAVDVHAPDVRGAQGRPSAGSTTAASTTSSRCRRSRVARPTLASSSTPASSIVARTKSCCCRAATRSCRGRRSGSTGRARIRRLRRGSVTTTSASRSTCRGLPHPGSAPIGSPCIAASNQECEPNSEYLVWAYTDAAIEGQLEIGPDSFEGIESWPLPAGKYIVRLLVDDSFIDLATSRTFTIRD